MPYDGCRPSGGRDASTAAGVAAGALVAVILLEGLGSIPHVRVPPPPPGQAGAAAPQLHLPGDHQNDLLHTYWSTAGFPDIVNGSPSFLRRQLPQRAALDEAGGRRAWSPAGRPLRGLLGSALLGL